MDVAGDFTVRALDEQPLAKVRLPERKVQNVRTLVLPSSPGGERMVRVSWDSPRSDVSGGQGLHVRDGLVGHQLYERTAQDRGDAGVGLGSGVPGEGEWLGSGESRPAA